MVGDVGALAVGVECEDGRDHAPPDVGHHAVLTLPEKRLRKARERESGRSSDRVRRSPPLGFSATPGHAGEGKRGNHSRAGNGRRKRGRGGEREDNVRGVR